MSVIRTCPCLKETFDISFLPPPANPNVYTITQTHILIIIRTYFYIARAVKETSEVCDRHTPSTLASRHIVDDVTLPLYTCILQPSPLIDVRSRHRIWENIIVPCARTLNLPTGPTIAHLSDGPTPMTVIGTVLILRGSTSSRNTPTGVYRCNFAYTQCEGSRS